MLSIEFLKAEDPPRRSLILATESKQMWGVPYSYVTAWDFQPSGQAGVIEFFYSGRRVRLTGRNLETLWFSLLEHRVSTITAVPRATGDDARAEVIENIVVEDLK